MAKPETVKIRCIVEQCKCAGERIKKGKTHDASPSDARYLVGTGKCEYVEKRAAPTPGITSKSVQGKDD